MVLLLVIGQRPSLPPSPQGAGSPQPVVGSALPPIVDGLQIWWETHDSSRSVQDRGDARSVPLVQLRVLA